MGQPKAGRRSYSGRLLVFLRDFFDGAKSFAQELIEEVKQVAVRRRAE